MSSLRDVLDAKDNFMTGHEVRSTARHYEKVVPALLESDAGIQKVVARIYPRWRTDQRIRAGRCIRIIYLYYRSPMTGRQCATELNMSYRLFSVYVTQIKRACDGRRMDGSGAYRPKRRKK